MKYQHSEIILLRISVGLFKCGDQSINMLRSFMTSHDVTIPVGALEDLKCCENFCGKVDCDGHGPLFHRC